LYVANRYRSTRANSPQRTPVSAVIWIKTVKT
jgi:hypothetical protein